jgi:sterol desaturase/sphingolipid hydroxylase (fatty acid hydroxylase superfamily)
MGLLALVEGVIPLVAGRSRGPSRVRLNLALTVLTLSLNAGLMTAAVRVAPMGPGPVVPFLLAVVVLDLATYAAHRTMHAIPFLWRAHRLHHADSFLDVTTTLRQHPLEGLWRFLWVIVPAWLLGLPASAVVLYRLLSVVQGLLEHANIDLGPRAERWLSPFIITPNLHKVHHSPRRAEHDSNYGNLFSAVDRLFGSFSKAEPGRSIEYGLEDAIRSPHGARAHRLADLGRSE